MRICSSSVYLQRLAMDRGLQGQLHQQRTLATCDAVHGITCCRATLRLLDSTHVPLILVTGHPCNRCQGKYVAMVTGCAPPTSSIVDPAVEPLHYWLPRLLAPVPRLREEQRREFCDMLVLRQDDAWLQLISMS